MIATCIGSCTHTLTHQSFTFGFPHWSHLMYLAAAEEKNSQIPRVFNWNVSNEQISSSLSLKQLVGLTFLLWTEVLVGVPGSLLLLVFGEHVSSSFRVL